MLILSGQVPRNLIVAAVATINTEVSSAAPNLVTILSAVQILLTLSQTPSNKPLISMLASSTLCQIFKKDIQTLQITENISQIIINIVTEATLDANTIYVYNSGIIPLLVPFLATVQYPTVLRLFSVIPLAVPANGGAPGYDIASFINTIIPNALAYEDINSILFFGNVFSNTNFAIGTTYNESINTMFTSNIISNFLNSSPMPLRNDVIAVFQALTNFIMFGYSSNNIYSPSDITSILVTTAAVLELYHAFHQYESMTLVPIAGTEPSLKLGASNGIIYAAESTKIVAYDPIAMTSTAYALNATALAIAAYGSIIYILTNEEIIAFSLDTLTQTTFKSGAFTALAVDSNGNVYYSTNDTLYTNTTMVTGFVNITCIATSLDGLVQYVGDAGATINSITNGIVSTVAGGADPWADGYGPTAGFTNLVAMTIDANGVLYVIDDTRLRVVNKGTVTTPVTLSAPSSIAVVDAQGLPHVFVINASLIESYIPETNDTDILFLRNCMSIYETICTKFPTDISSTNIQYYISAVLSTMSNFVDADIALMKSALHALTSMCQAGTDPDVFTQIPDVSPPFSWSVPKSVLEIVTTRLFGGQQVDGVGAHHVYAFRVPIAYYYSLFMYYCQNFNIIDFNKSIIYVIGYVVLSSLHLFNTTTDTNAIEGVCVLIVKACQANVDVYFDKTMELINVKVFFNNCGALQILQNLAQASNTTVRSSALLAINAILFPN